MAEVTIYANKDSYMNALATGVNYGSLAEVRVGAVYISAVKAVAHRAIGNFNVQALASATIVSAKLVQHVASATGTGVGDVTRNTRPETWTEFGVTWDDYDGVVAWTAGGGDLDEVTPGNVAFTLPNATGDWEITGMAGYVTDAIANRNNIVSVILRLDDEDPGSDNFAGWYSQDYKGINPPSPNVHWKLVVTYTGTYLGSLPHQHPTERIQHLLVR